MRRIPPLFLAVFAAACTCDGPDVETTRYRCSSSAECITGFSCAAGVCAKDGAGGSGGSGGSAGGGMGGGDAGGMGGMGGGGGSTGGGGGSTGGGDGGSTDGGGGSAGGDAGTDGGCVPTGPEACGDGVDNDCNALTDCFDPSCLGRRCAAGSACGTDAGCACNTGVVVANPSAAVFEIRTLSATLSNGVPKAAWAMPNANTFHYAECTANCGGLAPTFSSAVVRGPNPRVESGTMTANVNGGVLAATVASRTFTLSDGGTGTAYDLHYGQCTTACLTPASWTWVNVRSSIDNEIPALVSTAAFTGIAFADNGDVHYSECAAGCTTAGNWNDGVADFSSLSGRPGLATTGTTRAIAGTSGGFFHCADTACVVADTWARPYTGTGYDRGAFLHYQANGVPRIYGLAGATLRTSRCSTLPCTATANWTDTQLTAGLHTGFEQLDLAFDSSDRAVFAVRTAAAFITLMREEADGGYTTAPFPVCATQQTGALPVSLLTADGGHVMFWHQTNAQDVRYWVDPPP